MKEYFLNFIKPRVWTVLFSIFLIAWQYVYAYRGVDIEGLSRVSRYFDVGLSTISWDNFLIRTFSLGLIWVFVAMMIFLLLWFAESVSIGSHNRKIAKNYVNQSKEDYAHLLRTRSVGTKNRLISTLWLSGGIVLVAAGIFIVPSIVESMRNFFVFSYLGAAFESGDMVEYNNNALMISSFLLCYPIWYLYSALDSFCFFMSKEKSDEANLEENHFAVQVDDESSSFEDSDEDDEDDADSGSNFTPSHVI